MRNIPKAIFHFYKTFNRKVVDYVFFFHFKRLSSLRCTLELKLELGEGIISLIVHIYIWFQNAKIYSGVRLPGGEESVS